MGEPHPQNQMFCSIDPIFPNPPAANADSQQLLPGSLGKQKQKLSSGIPINKHSIYTTRLELIQNKLPKCL